MLIAWIIESKKYGPEGGQVATFMTYIGEIPFTHLGQFFLAIKDLYMNNLIILVFNWVLVGAMYYYADIPTNQKFKPRVYRIFGGLHGFVQIFVFYLVLWMISHFTWLDHSVYKNIIKQLMIYLGGGFVVSTIFGMHLFISNHLLGNHDNESFSSLQWEGFKNFLRIHVTKESVTIYPIGVKDISRWTLNEQKNKATTNREPEFHLIEKEIEIKAEIINH